MRRTISAAIATAVLIGGGALAQAPPTGSERPTVVQLVAPGHPAYLVAAASMKEAFLAASPQARVQTINLDLPQAEAQAKRALAETPSFVFAVGSRAAKVAQEARVPAPLVYAMVLDPSSAGLPAPGEKPTVDATGVSMDVAPRAQFDLVRELVPSARRIGVLYDPLVSGEVVRRAREAARGSGFTLVAQAVRSEGDVMAAANLVVSDVDVLWAIADPTVLTAANSRALILLSLRSRKPLIAVSEGFVRSGALAALAADPVDVGQRAGELAAQILAGASPRTIRPEGPPDLSLYVNRATADHIGVQLPAPVLGRARAIYPLP